MIKQINHKEIYHVQIPYSKQKQSAVLSKLINFPIHVPPRWTATSFKKKKKSTTEFIWMYNPLERVIVINK